MKNSFIVSVIITLLLYSISLNGQVLQISYPIYQGVYQRDNSDNANIPVCGQILGYPASSPGTYTVECITNRLDENGSIIAGTSSSTIITYSTQKGYFNGSIIRGKGWYSLQIKYTFNATGYTSSNTTKFGVGDVFIVAGQSNAQGDNGAIMPTTSIPEWIVANNEEWNCRKEFENRPSSLTKVGGANKIAPAGNNSWCYGILGKKISDANGGMPVAFFNTAAGGSSIKNWNDGANGNSTGGYFNPSSQWCDGYVSGQPTSYYVGQPYLTLKNVLNWYVPMFGVRSILWHQGESDALNTYDPNTQLTRNSVVYTNLLNGVIAKSQEHSNISNLSWMVAQVSYSNDNTTGGTTPNYNATSVLNGQSGTINSIIKVGPLTDKYGGSSTGGYRYDNTHFSEGSGNGLTLLATLWNGYIDPGALTSFNRISPKSIPSISILQSGSTYTFSVSPVSGASYCWTTSSTNSPPLSAFSCLSTGTSVVSGSAVKCFIGTPNASSTAINWIATGIASPQNCPGCREVVSELDEAYSGINLNVYPNPSPKDFKVEFDVVENDLHVKLELLDMEGNSVKIVADGNHAKGHFVYPINEEIASRTLICQLKVGDIYISRKIQIMR